MQRMLGGFEMLVMLAVWRMGETGYGAAIRRLLEARTGRPVSAGAVYTTLGRLRTRGLIASRLTPRPPGQGGRHRRCYRLRHDGVSQLLESHRSVLRMSAGGAERLEHLEGDLAAPPRAGV